MKILTHGHLYRAVCNECGCEFTLSHTEATELMQEQSAKKPGSHAVRCPDCGCWAWFSEEVLGRE